MSSSRDTLDPKRWERVDRIGVTKMREHPQTYGSRLRGKSCSLGFTELHEWRISKILKRSIQYALHFPTPLTRAKSCMCVRFTSSYQDRANWLANVRVFVLFVLGPV